MLLSLRSVARRRRHPVGFIAAAALQQCVAAHSTQATAAQAQAQAQSATAAPNLADAAAPPSSTLAQAAASVPKDPVFRYSSRDEDLSVGLPALRYPVVLVHGYLGYASLIRAPWPWSGPLLEYFGSVRTHLSESSQGGITVLTPVNPPAASIAARAKKLRWALGLQSDEEESTAAQQGKRVEEKKVEGSSEHTERKVTGASSDKTGAEENGAADASTSAASSNFVEFQDTGGHFDASKHQSDSAPLAQHRAEERGEEPVASPSGREPSPQSTASSAPERGPPAPGTTIILGGQQIDLRTYTGKFHLIAHSMGGLDCRYLLAQLQAQGERKGESHAASSRIASLTTVSSPHRGSPVADILLDVLDVPLSFHSSPDLLARAPSLNKFSRWAAGLFGIDVSGISNLSTEAMRGFNQRVKDAPGVAYQSYGGAKRFPFYSVWYAPSRVVRQFEDIHDHSHDAPGEPCPGGENDGLVSINSARWGAYRGTTSLDHLEQIGLGVWNKHLPLYRQIVFRLKEIEEEETNSKQGKQQQQKSRGQHGSLSEQRTDAQPERTARTAPAAEKSE